MGKIFTNGLRSKQAREHVLIQINALGDQLQFIYSLILNSN